MNDTPTRCRPDGRTNCPHPPTVLIDADRPRPWRDGLHLVRGDGTTRRDFPLYAWENWSTTEAVRRRLAPVAGPCRRTHPRTGALAVTNLTQTGLPIGSSVHWTADAACIGVDPELWHDPNPAGPATYDAIRICMTCPVRQRCLQAGIAGRESGVWGGRWMSEGIISRRRPRPIPTPQNERCAACGGDLPAMHGNGRYCNEQCRRDGRRHQWAESKRRLRASA
jgi:hypothetical protein